MSPFSFSMAIILILCLFYSSFVTACLHDEKRYLQDFRGALNDTFGLLNSWQRFNCCQWQGVICDYHSGHVISLDLSGSGYYLKGKIHPALSNLHHLQHLDLSGHYLTAIPSQLGNLQRLTFLSLAFIGNGGEIPPELGNITSLRYLDLSNTFVNGKAGWIKKLVNLEYLNMGYVDLSMASEEIGNALSGISNLREIDLSNCGLSGTILPSLQNLTHLFDLSLSGNPFYSPLPSWFQNTSAMVSLDLSECDLIGSLPSNFLHSSNMRKIDLFYNNLVGLIPLSIANISTLETLDLSYNNFAGDLHRFCSFVDRHLHLRFLVLNNNQLSGTIPDTISKFIRLEALSLSFNNLTAISPSVLEMPHLKQLYLSSHLTFDISSAWIPQYLNLEYLELVSCNLQGEIPAFLSTQYSLESLDLSDNNIVGNIPTWLWDLPRLHKLNLSHNSLEGSLPTVISTDMFLVDLHSNSLYGSIPDFQSCQILDMSENKFTGSIPPTICSRWGMLVTLDLSKNDLTGAIPRNLSACADLGILNLAHNKLEGEIPEGLGEVTHLQTLNLNQNNFEGLISPSIANCTLLRVLDLGNNRIQGSIPIAIGKLPDLRILNLGFNKLQGSFLPELLTLKNLQILDLSHNNLSGFIPQSLAKLNAMANQTQSGKIEMRYWGSFKLGDVGPMFPIGLVNQVTLWIKGRSLPYPKIREDFKFMDLSHNKFSGNIPEEIGELKGLIGLNISNNNMKGRIPESMAGMTHLESLDLSGNMLSGNIPADLVNLTSLSVLDLSYNNLSGYIPQGEQFATFEASSYVGNHNLHGWPLEEGKQRASRGERDGEEGRNHSTGVTDANGDETDVWWGVAVGLSFGVGFGSIIAALCVHLRLRCRCFTLMDNFIQDIFER